MQKLPFPSTLPALISVVVQYNAMMKWFERVVVRIICCQYWIRWYGRIRYDVRSINVNVHDVQSKTESMQKMKKNTAYQVKEFSSRINSN